MIKYNPKVDWFSLWYSDRKSMADTMRRNLKADLDAGYDLMGHSVINQYQDINQYEEETEKVLMGFVEMTEGKVNRWCFYDMLRRGAID